MASKKSLQEQAGHNTDRYYNIAQLRTDIWAEIKNRAHKLSRKHSEKSSELIISDIEKRFKILRIIEQYWSFPGLQTLDILTTYLRNHEYKTFYVTINEILQLLMSQKYRSYPVSAIQLINAKRSKKRQIDNGLVKKRYFEVLFVDDMSGEEETSLRRKLLEIRDIKDPFYYQLLLAHTFQDALIALLFNPNIQVVIIQYGIQYKSKHANGFLKPFITSIFNWQYEGRMESEIASLLGQVIKEIRPELDIYFVTDTAISDIPDQVLLKFRRIFYRLEDLQEIHLSILHGISERFKTPFFTALKEYSRRPTGIFHAMPISRGNSIFKSNWIDDFGDFYGRNIFLAETSSTTGGLDSLLQPTGPLKKAQELAAKAFGAQHTFFVTNGTSTSNKIVLQALVEPEDVVLIDRDCHKSHHYGMVLSGSYVVYLDSYPIEAYSMYGAVSLATIKNKLLELKKAGRLDRVKMLLLTNCTFDGVVYNVERVMEEVLAIKPDMIFVWDEAWFGFAAFTYTFKQRTAMYVADKLANKYETDEYRKTYEDHIKKIKSQGKDAIPLLPDPDKVKIRVYSTQSTHKTLSSMRQASMIHIYDQEFKRKSEDAFHEAYMTHTSTSANYQILASLDAGRRQVMFEGYELVEKSIEMAMILRAKINDHPKISRYFKVLAAKDIIPGEYRSSGLKEYYDKNEGWNRMETSWQKDEFVLDPTKITLLIGATGVDGDTFKNKFLMDQFSIQINKTSRNTVLFMTNIGTTRSSVSYLISVLLKISQQLDEKSASLNPEETKILNQKIKSLVKDTPPLPDFSYFHDSFRAIPGVPGGKIREAYFLSYKEHRCEYIRLEHCEKAINDGRKIVSANFVIPYPPGFPVLVPGQVLTLEILKFLLALDVTEIHGYRKDLGLRIFAESALNRQKSASALMGTALGKGNGEKGKKKNSTISSS